MATAVERTLRENKSQVARESESAWFDPKTDDPGMVLPLLKQYPSELMEVYPVDRMVNSPANDVPGCIVSI